MSAGPTTRLSEHGGPAEVTLELQPIQRLIEPEEVADMAGFLIGSSRLSFVRTAVSMDHG